GRSCGFRCSRVGLVHRLGQLVRRGGQFLPRCVQFRRTWRAFQRLLGVGQRAFHFTLVAFRNFVAAVLQHLFDVVDQTVQLVPRFDFLALRLVFRGVGVGIFRHALHFFLAQA